MRFLKNSCSKLITQKWFELFVIGIILLNSALIGVETYFTNHAIKVAEHAILGVFTFEIIIRFIARKDLKSFFTSGWNIFDLSLVMISYVPESLFANSGLLMILRILRIFRVLRLLRTSDEIKLIVSVLAKSMSALFYNGVFFFIFLYLFSIVGVSLFRMPEPENLSPEMRVKYSEIVTLAPNGRPDPYGSLGEAMFTLFRALTGDDWTSLRYNLGEASKHGLIHAPLVVITSFHVIWFILAAFLLLNLVVGAIVNNYQVIMEESRAQKKLEAELKAAEKNAVENI